MVHSSLKTQFSQFFSRMLLGVVLVLSNTLYAQTGIGTDKPNKAAALDIQSDQRGLLIPRVELNSFPDPNDDAESLLVYNKTENGGFNKGFYCWFGGEWVRLLADGDLTKDSGGGSNSEVWIQQGNQSYHKGNVAIGKVGNEESNNNHIIFEVAKENGDNALTIRKDGWVGIGYKNKSTSSDYTSFTTDLHPYIYLDMDSKTLVAKTIYNVIDFAVENLDNLLISIYWQNFSYLVFRDFIDYVIYQERNGKYSYVNNHEAKEMLRVNGAVLATDMYFPDYVFQDYFKAPKQKSNPDYKFRSLDQTKAYIKTHKHLPGITPAWALPYSKEEGYRFNLSQLSIKSLEKIEELYLHTIEQDEKINHLKKQITTAKTQYTNTKTAKKIKQLKKDKTERSKRINRLEQRVANLAKNK